MTKSRGACVGIALLFLSWPAIGRSADPAVASRELRVQIPTEPVSLDPALAEDDFAARVLGNTMDGLVGYDGAGKLENRLARSHSISADRKTYAFRLRKGALWSDGKPVTAQDFVVGVRRALDPKTGAKIANLLFSIRGARDYNTGKGEAERIGVTARGDRVVFELERPTSHFIHVLAIAQALPSRADVLAANSGRWPESGPATGPYVLESHAIEQEIRLKPNPRWWRLAAAKARAGKPALVPVVLKVVPDEATAASLFEQGQLDVVTRVAPADAARFRAVGVLHEYPQAATYFLSFNARKVPFDDREFRRAVAGSVRRREILDALMSPHRIADGWLPPELLAGKRAYLLRESVFAASVRGVAERLKSAPLSVTAAFNALASNSVVMEKIQFDLRKALGLEVALQQLDWKSYVALVRSDTPQIYRFQRGAPLMDPSWHLLSFKSDDANNPTGWKNEAYDRAVDEVVRLAPGPARQKAIERAERILIEEEAIVVPLFFTSQSHLVAARVKGYRANPINVALFADISLK